MQLNYGKFLLLFLALVLAVASAPAAAAEGEKPAEPSASDLREQALEDYAYHWGVLAYVWGWPAINLHNRRWANSTLTEPSHMGGVLPGAPVNHVCMLTDYMKPDQRGCIDPNQDVVYGSGFADLSVEPVVIQIPDFGDRYWILHLMDAYTDVPAAPGFRAESKPGFYLLVGPDWEGEAPEGIVEVLRSPTNLVWYLPRAFMNDTEEDRAALQPLLELTNVYPLSEYDGTVKTKDWSQVPDAAAVGQSPDGKSEARWVRDERFWEDLALVLAENKPRPGEAAMVENFQRLLDERETSAAVKRGLDRAVVDGSKMVTAGFPLSNLMDQFGNGWAGDLKGGEYGHSYLRRAWVTKAIIGVNKPIDAFYLGTDNDGDGEPLNGKYAYTVTFPKGEPPAQNFWSLTLYDHQRFFAPNPINRFSLGTKRLGQMNVNDDGSLTIYVQSESPGGDKEANWLPSPAGEPFGLQLRIYIPKEIVLTGEYTPPPAKKVRSE